MITHKIKQKTTLTCNECTEGETIEMKLRRIIDNKEPISDGAPIIYTPRKEGIRPSTNIRTDRFEIAVDATSIIEKSYKARREERQKPKDDGKAEPTEGKGVNTPTT